MASVPVFAGIFGQGAKSPGGRVLSGERNV